MSHIATSRSLSQGGIKIRDECQICLTAQDLVIGYVGTYCPNCKRDSSHDSARGYLLTHQREYLGLTRKELAARLGVSPATVKRYEWGHGSDKYANRIKELIKSNTNE